MINAQLLRRGTDSHGSGEFGASRGSRTHKGIDFAACLGQKIVSPVSGRVTKLGYPYGNDLSYRYVEVTTENQHRHRFFYVSPLVRLGDSVWEQVTCLGKVQDLCKRYPGITQHVHYEIIVDGKYVDPDKYHASF